MTKLMLSSRRQRDNFAQYTEADRIMGNHFVVASVLLSKQVLRQDREFRAFHIFRGDSICHMTTNCCNRPILGNCADQSVTWRTLFLIVSAFCTC